MERNKPYWDKKYEEGVTYFNLTEAQKNIILQGLSVGDTVLDIGSGAGEVLKLCEDNNINGVGIDVSSAAIRLTRELGVRSSQILHDINGQEMPKFENKFNKIILKKALVFIQEKKKILQWAKEHLSIGGELIIINQTTVTNEFSKKGIEIDQYELEKCLKEVFQVVISRDVERTLIGDISTYVCSVE